MRNPFKRDHDKDAKAVKESLKRAEYDGVSNEQIMAEDQIVDKLFLRLGHKVMGL